MRLLTGETAGHLGTIIADSGRLHPPWTDEEVYVVFDGTTSSLAVPIAKLKRLHRPRS